MHLPNIRYLTGFSGTAAIVAVLPHELIFLSDFRYRIQAEDEVGDLARVEIETSDLWKRLWQVLGEYSGMQAMGFEGHCATVSDVQRFSDAGLRMRVQPASQLVERLRAQKDPGEVAAIREAARLALEALEASLRCIRVGEREIDVARSALPHARTSQREIGSGDWLLLDFGAQVDGYCADITRTVVMGRQADERQRTVYELVREAQLAARESIRAGMTGREADGIARSLLTRRGFGEAFGHSLGHGLGLEVHEGPRVSKANDEPLPERAGAVVGRADGIAGVGVADRTISRRLRRYGTGGRANGRHGHYS